MEKRKSRIEAARELLAIANCYEPRRLKLATVYRKIYRTLELKRVPDNGFYRLDYEYFRDAHGRLWRNAGRIGERPLRLYHCEPSGEPSGPIWGDVGRVLVEGVETDFIRREAMI